MSAEIIAILKALKYLCDKPNRGAVVYTDSLSAINVIRDKQPKSNLLLCYRNKYILIKLNK